MRRKKVEKKRPGRPGGAEPSPVNNSVNDFFFPSLSDAGQSPRAAANGQPRGAVTQRPLLSGPPSPIGPWESGSGSQVPRSILSFPQTCHLALPKPPKGALPGPAPTPDSGVALRPAGSPVPSQAFPARCLGCAPPHPPISGHIATVASLPCKQFLPASHPG